MPKSLMVNLRNNVSLKAGLAVLLLALIGIIRTVLEVKLGICLDAKWFSYSPDILFAMACYPVHLCFFIFMCLHLIFRAYRIQNTGRKLIVFLFLIQLSHLLIPFLDYYGFTYNVPYNFLPLLNAQTMSYDFTLNPFADLKNIYFLPIYFTPFILLFTLVTTLGINLTWLMVGIGFVFFLLKGLRIPAGKTIAVTLIIFQIIYWPVYKYHFVFNWIFNRLTGVHDLNFYGYGTYFLVSGAIGFYYFLAVSRKKEF